MLYATTRSKGDRYSPRHVLGSVRAPDGGLYVPAQNLDFSHEEIRGLKDKRFGQCIADVLNGLFDTAISSWDVQCSVGRYPVRFTQLQNRILMVESWHNLDWHFKRMVSNLVQRLRSDSASDVPCSEWAEIAVRIAVLFGVYGELLRQGFDEGETFDISVVSGDFSAPVSAWYARQWGLPIGNIVCACNENGNIWDFFSHGQLRTGAVALRSVTPEADAVIPDSLERLIYICGDETAVDVYLDTCRRGGTYYADEELLTKLRSGMYITVSSSPRILSTIPNVYNTGRYLMSPYTALAYAGLMDYRSKNGFSGNAVILSERSPVCDIQTVSEALDITADQLTHYLNN